jgi:hypothetical protein
VLKSTCCDQQVLKAPFLGERRPIAPKILDDGALRVAHRESDLIRVRLDDLQVPADQVRTGAKNIAHQAPSQWQISFRYTLPIAAHFGSTPCATLRLDVPAFEQGCNARAV